MKLKNNKDKSLKGKKNNKNEIILLNKKLSNSPTAKNIKINNIFIFNTDKKKFLKNNNSNKDIQVKNRKLNSSPKSNLNPTHLTEYIFPLKKNQAYLEINDLIGEATKSPINLIFNKFCNEVNSGKISNKSYGKIKAYAANTNKGIIRNYNEDRVSIVINMNQPNNYNGKTEFPRISYFGIFDGHGGSKCAEYLRDNLLQLICTNKYFPSNINLSIREAFKKADEDFLNNYSLHDGKIVDFSGSCGLFLLLMNNDAYIANVGDSRCLISCNSGKYQKSVTRDHKPNLPYEKERIINNGGIIYQSQNVLNIEDENIVLKGKILIGPHRVLPGRLSVSRTVGDPEAKLKNFGGLPNIVINEPDIYSFNIDKDKIDYFILGCDGIFDQLNDEDVFECVSLVIDHKKKLIKDNNNIDIHSTCGDIVNLILNASMQRKSFDNVTCILICFKDLLNMDKEKEKRPLFNNIKQIHLSKSSKNNINNIKLKNRVKEISEIKEENLNFQTKKLKNNYSDQMKNKKSEKNKNTIDYPNPVKKRIMLYSNKFSHRKIFNNSFNGIKSKKSPKIKINGINNNKKIEIYINNSNLLKKDNISKNLNNSHSLKYYTFTEKYRNNSSKNLKKVNNRINMNNFYNKISSSKKRNKAFKSNSLSRKKLMRTEGNELNRNKDKNFYVNIIFNREKNLRNPINKKKYLSKENFKSISIKNITKNNSIKNNKSIQRIFDSPRKNNKNFSTYSSYNSQKKHKDKINIGISSINLDFKKYIDKTNSNLIKTNEKNYQKINEL